MYSTLKHRCLSWRAWCRAPNGNDASRKVRRPSAHRAAQPRNNQAQPRNNQAQPRNNQAQPRNNQAQPRNNQAQPRNNQMIYSHSLLGAAATRNAAPEKARASKTAVISLASRKLAATLGM